MDERVGLVTADGGRRMMMWKEGRSMGSIMYTLVTLPSVWIGVLRGVSDAQGHYASEKLT